MADSDRNNAFWCYQCRRVVQRGVTEQDDSASCGICGSGFVEDLRTVDVQSALLRNRGRLRDVQGDLSRATESLRVSLQSISQMDSDDLGRFLPLVREIARGAPNGTLEVLQRLGVASSSQANGNGGTDQGGGNESQGESSLGDSSLGDSASGDSSMVLRGRVGRRVVNGELEGIDDESSEGVVFDNSGAENSSVGNSGLETAENNTSEMNLEGEGRSRDSNNGVRTDEGDNPVAEGGGEGETSPTVPLLNELEETLELMRQAFDGNDWESMSEGDEDDEEEDDEWEEWVEDQGEEEEGGEEEEENNNEEDNNNESAEEGVEVVTADDVDLTVESEPELGNRGQETETGRRYRFRPRQSGNPEDILPRGREPGTDFAATLQQLMQNLELRADRVRDMVMVGNPGGMYIGNPGDYLDARGFEAFVQHMAANDNSRRGPPPASKAAVEALILVHVDDNCHSTGLSLCAICKDMGEVGETMSQMPCSHLYHGDCIKQWLSSRNSCPVCRYELATDDPDYEEQRKAREIQREEISSSSSTEVGESPSIIDHVISQEERRSESVSVEEESESVRSSGGQIDTVEDPDSRNRDRDINILTVSDAVSVPNQGSRLEQYSGEHLSLTDGTERLTEVANGNLSQVSNSGDAIGVTRRANHILDIGGRVLQLGGLLVALYLGHRLGRATTNEEDDSLLVGNSSPYQQHREGGRHDFEDRYATD